MKGFKGFGKRAGKINETLFEMLIGIFAVGVIFQVTIVWFVKARMAYSTGLWIGVILAGFLAWNMWRTLDRALDCGEAGAQKQLQRWSVLRYMMTVIVLAAIMCSRIANPLAAFLGVMTLKVAAYLQPVTHKVLIKLRR